MIYLIKDISGLSVSGGVEQLDALQSFRSSSNLIPVSLGIE